MSLGLLQQVQQIVIQNSAFFNIVNKMSEEIEAHVLAKYKPIKKIGSGAYGHVFKVSDRRTKKIRALKKNFDAFNNSTDAQRTYRQIMFLMELRHPNIIELEQVIMAENGKDIYLVFEHMDVDLHKLIRESILAQKHKKYILYQTAKAMLYLHSAGLIHRDLKPSNILVNESCEAKLCDFGLVRSIDDQNESSYDILTEYIATRWYRAPEILLRSRGYSKGIDIWSFGCLLAEMVKGKPLFPGTSTINQLERVMMWTGPPSQTDVQSLNLNFGKEVLEIVFKTKKANKRQFFNEISSECLDLISRCLEFNPEKRISIEQILQHPYLSQFYDRSEICISDRKIRIPIDDNRRLSLKDYRSLISQQVKRRSKSRQNYDISANQESNLYRIRQKPKKTIRTEETEPYIKQTVHMEPPKKSSLGYQNESRTLSMKKPDASKKKTFYKASSLYSKNLRTIEPDDEQQQIQKINEKIKKQKQRQKQKISEARKVALLKEAQNSTKTQWNKAKRSMTQGDHKNMYKY